MTVKSIDEGMHYMHEVELKIMIVYVTMATVATILLSAILFVLLVNPRKLLNSPCNRFACSLLSAHILNSLAILLLNSFFINNRWIPEQLLVPPQSMPDIELIVILYDVCIALKMLVSANVLLLTVDRFIALRLHLRYNLWLTNTKQMVFIALAWLFPNCQLVVFRSFNRRQYQPYILFFVIVFSLFSLSFFNASIYTRIRHHLKAMRQNTASSDFTGRLQLNRKETRALKITFAIVTSYVVAFIPEMVSKLLEIMKSTEDEIMLTSAFLFVINSLIDAVVYLVLNKEIRKCFKKCFWINQTRKTEDNIDPKSNVRDSN